MRSGLPLTLGAVGALAVAAAFTRSGSRAFGQGGHWGRAGAGVLLTTGQRVLVLLRSNEVTEPGTWNLAGGAVDPGEDPLTAGLRELEEETGLEIEPDDARVVGSTVWQSPGSSFRYTTSVVRVPQSMTKRRVRLNWENDEALWVDAAWLDAHRSELHPGLRAVLPELMRLAFGGRGSRSTDPTQTPAFRRWFGESKVVDEAGKPRVVYHGTASDFDRFDAERIGSNFSVSRGGFFFVSNKEAAWNYADDAADQQAEIELEPRVISAYLALKNPLIIKASHNMWPDMYFDDDADAILRRAHRGGHDGVIVHGIDPYSDNEPRSIYIAFRPEQIKSVDNRGTFDPNDPRISYNRTSRPPTSFRDLAAWTAWARTQGVELRLVKTPSYAVEITDLFADATGTGAGTRVMEALVKAADKAGMPLVLHPSSPRNVVFYGRFGFSLFGSYGMMRREPKGRGSRAATTAPVVLYHGAQRWEGAPEIVAHRKGHAEHGPGIYLTTSYETAARYAKGGGSVYRMELRPGVRWLQDAKLDKGPVLRWLKGLSRLRGKEQLVAGIERVASRTGDTFPAEILVNQFVNAGASSGQHGPALAAFLVEHGVDASLTSPPMFGGSGGAHGEDWVVVFNPAVLRSVTKVPVREVGKQAKFDLPRVKR